MADASLSLDRIGGELRQHQLRVRLARAIRALRQANLALATVSYRADAPQDLRPSTALGHIAAITDHALPAAAGLQGFDRIAWQLNRQAHRSRRRAQIEQQLEAAAQTQE